MTTFGIPSQKYNQSDESRFRTAVSQAFDRANLVEGRGVRLGGNFETDLGYTPGVVSPAATLAPAFTNTFMVAVTLTENLTMNAPVGLSPGDTAFLVIRHSGGPFTITWNAVYDFPGGAAPALSGGKDIVTLVVDDQGEISAVFSLAFS